MKYLTKFILITLLIIFSLSTIYLWIQKNQLKHLLDTNQSVAKTDTFYLGSNYTGLEVFSKSQNPDKVEIFKPALHTQNFALSKTLNKSATVAHDSIISFRIEQNRLTLDALVNDTSYQRKYFGLDPTLYIYNYTNGNLTKKRLPFIKRFKPYMVFSYRPINNFWDLSGGIKFKTRKFNYKLGINLSYYPKFNSGIYKDIELGITYNF